MAGLALFGPTLIRTVGSKITKPNRVRAFCVTLSAAITVIFASALGLPVSSTHIAIGALFGVGFLREVLANRGNALLATPEAMPAGSSPLAAPAEAAVPVEKQRRRYLFRRSHLITIISAWLITVPASALLAGLLATVLTRLSLPMLG